MSPGGLVAQAGAWAAQLHQYQRRKVSGAPYLAHLLGAAGAVATMSADPVAIAAAFLHDAIEDQGATLADARAALNDPNVDAVWRVVESCSDSLDRTRPTAWRARKEAFLANLDALTGHPDDTFVRRVTMVVLGDKVYNARSIEHELRAEGAAAFERMSGRADAVTWYLPELSRRLSNLAARTGDAAVQSFALEYRETVDRIVHIHELLPTLEREVPVGRAADLAMGINEIEIPDSNGASVLVSVRLTPFLPLKAHGHPVVGRSIAAAQPEFVDAFRSAIAWACDAFIEPDRPALPRLGHAFGVGAITLEHGGTTAEACAAMLIGVTGANRAVDLTTDAVSARLGADAGPATAAILAGCRRLAPRNHRGVPFVASRQLIAEPSRDLPQQQAVYRVIAADEIPRAVALEQTVKRQAVPLVDGQTKHRIAELNALSVVVTEHLGGSLALVMEDITARIRMYLDVSNELVNSSATRGYTGGREDFALTGSDGRQYWVEVKVGARSTVRPERSEQLRFDLDR